MLCNNQSLTAINVFHRNQTKIVVCSHYADMICFEIGTTKLFKSFLVTTSQLKLAKPESVVACYLVAWLCELFSEKKTV